jgi:eukaryotic-like serine/threonine-protein kinase
MNVTETHPAPEQVAALALGMLPEAEIPWIADHVAVCESCRRLLDESPESTLVARLRDGERRRAESGHDVAAEQRSRTADDPPSGYELLEVLGRGGMGVVYKARQVGLKRLVALKQLRWEAMAGPDDLIRFRKEAEAVAQLRHPHIVQIHDVGRREGLPFFAMELVAGGTLAERLTKGPLAARVAAQLVATVARAVEHAHQAGILHRDLKPANILLAPDLDTPKIGDFGLAKWVDDDSLKTRTGMILGTPSYMAPELATGSVNRVGPATDVYALGAILYETLTGRPPFKAASALETLDQVRSFDPPPPRKLQPGVPRDLQTICLKCLEKDSRRRYASAQELANDLERFLSGAPVVARSIGPTERLVKWARRRPSRAALLAMAILGPLGLITLVLISNARLRAEVARTEARAIEARAQRLRADANYRRAREVIGNFLGRINVDRALSPAQMRELHSQVVEDALNFYDGVLRQEGAVDPLVRFDTARALVHTANFHILRSQWSKAETNLVRALRLLDGLAEQSPNNAQYTAQQIDALNKLGHVQGDGGRLDEAVKTFRRGIELSERLAHAAPSSLEYGDNLAWGHHNLGSVLLSAGRWRESGPHTQKAIDVRERLIRAHPENGDLRARLGESLNNRAYGHVGEGDLVQAEAEYRRADGWIKPLLRDASRKDRAISLGDLYLNWGNLILQMGRHDAAVARYTEGIDAVERVLRDDPEWAVARVTALKLHGARAQTLVALNRYAEGVKDWERVIALADRPEEKRRFRLSLAVALARHGQAARAVAEAEAFAPALDPKESGPHFYNVACVLSLARGAVQRTGESPIARQYAQRSLYWLRRAQSVGFFHDQGAISQLDGDPDLDGLRALPEFQILRSDLIFPDSPFARSS